MNSIYQKFGATPLRAGSRLTPWEKKSVRHVFGYRLSVHATYGFFAAILLIVSASLSNTCFAGVITFQIGGPDFSGDGNSTSGGNTFGGSGAILPSATSTVTISDMVAGLGVNEVKVTWEFLAPSGADGMNFLWLNLADNTLASDLRLSNFVDDGTGLFKSFDSTFAQLAGTQVDGAGRFNIEVELKRSNTIKFSPGETVMFNLSLAGTHAAGTLTSASFDSRSEGGNPGKEFFAAVHINNTGNGESGHYAGQKPSNIPIPGAVPEPASLAMWGLGLLGLAGVRRVRQSKKAVKVA